MAKIWQLTFVTKSQGCGPCLESGREMEEQFLDMGKDSEKTINP